MHRSHGGGQRLEYKRSATKRDDKPDVFDHLTHLHRKHRRCQMEK